MKFRKATAFLCILVLLACCLPAGALAEESADTRIHLDFRVPSNRSGAQTEAGAPSGSPLADPDPISPELHSPKALTLMVYMCGSDLESVCSAGTRDMLEMFTSGFNPDGVNVLVMTGGSTRWAIPDLPALEKRVWEIRPDLLVPLYLQAQPQSWAEMAPLVRQSMVPAVAEKGVSMGDPQTLTDFLDFSHTWYPADRYALVIWNHGGGPNHGMCLDLLFDKDLLSSDELVRSLSTSCFAKEKLEWIGFDACLMGSAELALQLAPYARYMIASEESEPGFGWDYGFFWGIERDADGAETGKRIVDSFFDVVSEAYENRTDSVVTLSCINLGCMDALQQAADAFFTEADRLLSAENYTLFARSRDNAVSFGHTEDPKALDADLVDLSSFLSQPAALDNPYREPLLQALQSAVVCSKAIMAEPGGLSVYFPFYSPRAFPALSDVYSGVSFSPAYLRFIEHFVRLLSGQSMANYGGLVTRGSGDAVKDYRSLLSLNLTDEQVESLAEARLMVFEKDEATDAYALVSFVPDVHMEEGQLSAEYVHRALFITDRNGNPVSPALPYTHLDNGSYSVEAALVRNGETEASRRKALLRLSLNDKTGALSVVSILGWDESAGTYTSRYGLDLADFDSLEIIRPLKTPVEFLDQTLVNWENWTTVGEEVYSLSLDGSSRLMMLHNRLPWEKLYAGFLLRDYQNNRYISALARLAEEKRDNLLIVQYDDLNALVLSDPKVTVRDNARFRLLLTMNVQNISERESLVRLENLALNGATCPQTAEIYGNGENDGLLPLESQLLTLAVPADALEGQDILTELTFDLLLLDPVSLEETARVPVIVSLNQPL